MSRCAVDAVTWNDRRAYRLSNAKGELTVLLGRRARRGFSSLRFSDQCSLGVTLAFDRAADIFFARAQSTLRRWSRRAFSVRLHRTCPGARLLRHAVIGRGEAGSAPA